MAVSGSPGPKRSIRYRRGLKGETRWFCSSINARCYVCGRNLAFALDAAKQAYMVWVVSEGSTRCPLFLCLSVLASTLSGSRCRDPSASGATLLECIRPGSGEAWQAEKHSDPYISTIDIDITQQRQSSVASRGSHWVSCPQYGVHDYMTRESSLLGLDPPIDRPYAVPFRRECHSLFH